MHLFNKENIWSNPCSFLHTSSHPDNYKNNNSVNRNYFQRKGERRYPRRDSFKDLIPTQIQEYPVKIQGEILHSTRNPASYKLILYTELILQEIQGSSYAGLLQQLLPVYPSILHGRIKSPSVLQCSRPLQHKQASSNSRRQKQHSTRQPAATQPFQQLPGAYYKEST